MNPLTQSPLEKLILARAILEQPENWTQGTYARDDEGWPCLEDHPESVCWCMSGACRLAYANPMLLAYELVPGWCVPQFNDLSLTKHSDVLSVFDRAIAKLL